MGWILLLALWQDAERPRLLAVSIDGLPASAVDRLADVAPHLARLRAQGRAWDLDACTPAMTHPGHVTLLAGRDPIDHGIFFNEFGMTCLCVTGRPARDYDAWFPESAIRAGLRVAAFGWAEVLHMEGLSPNVPYDPSIHQRDNDEAQTGRAEAEIRRGEADVVLLYLAYLDKVEHERGPLVREDGTLNDTVLAALRQMDERVGRVVAAAQEMWGERARIAIASDHGFTTGCDRCAACARVEAAVTRGLTRFRGTCCAPGRCFAGGCEGHACACGEGILFVRGQGVIAVFAPRGIAAEERERRLSQARESLPEGYALLEGDASGRGLLFSVNPPEGHAFSRGEGVHGHPGDFPSMRCAFILWGTGPGQTGRGRQRDVAPTLADLFGFELPGATGSSLLP